MTPTIITIWIAIMVATVSASAVAFYKSWQAAGRQQEVDDMLSRKHVTHHELEADSGSFTTIGSTATLLVEEGERGDVAKAEEPDR